MADEQTVKVNGKDVPTHTLYNAIRNGASDYYKSHVPVANAKNLQQTAEAIAKSNLTMNTFYNAMSQIGRMNVNATEWQDPLDTLFNQGTLERGVSVENMLIGWVDEQVFSYADAEKVFAVEKPNLTTLYSTLNRRSKYKVTVSMPEVKSILVDQGPEAILTRITGSLNNSIQRDNTRYVKEIIGQAIANRDVIFKIAPSGDNADKIDYTELIAQMKEDYTTMQWPDNDQHYNVMGIDNPSDQSHIMTVLSAHIMARVDVNVLASAFNMDKTDFVGQRVPINSFDDGNVVALMMDDRFIQIYDYLREDASIFNPEILATNYWAHVWKLYTYVKFFNAIVYVKSLPDDFAAYSQFFVKSMGKNIVIPTYDQVVDVLPLYANELNTKAAANADSKLKLDLSVTIDDPVQSANGPKVALVQQDGDTQNVLIADITAGNNGTASIDATKIDGLGIRITANTSQEAASANYNGSIKLTTSLVDKAGTTVLLQPADLSIGMSKSMV